MTLEQKVAEQLRSLVLAHLQINGISEAAFGETLGIRKEFAHDLLGAPRWEVGYALQVLDRLGVALQVTPA